MFKFHKNTEFIDQLNNYHLHMELASYSLGGDILAQVIYL